MRRLGVARNRNVDVLERRISVAEGNRRNVDVRRLNDGLMIGQRIGDDQQTRLTESLLDLIGEGTGRVTTGDRGRLGVVGELEDGTLAVLARRDGEDLHEMDNTNDELTTNTGPTFGGFVVNQNWI